MDKDIRLRLEAEKPNPSGEVDVERWAERWAYEKNIPVEQVKEFALVREVDI